MLANVQSCDHLFLCCLSSDFRQTFRELRAFASLLTFDEVSDVAIVTGKRSIDGPFDTQLVLHSFGVAFQVSVQFSDFVDVDFIILMGQTKK